MIGFCFYFKSFGFRIAWNRDEVAYLLENAKNIEKCFWVSYVMISFSLHQIKLF